MFRVVLPWALLLSSVVLPAIAQFSGDDDDDFNGGFSPDALTMGVFAIACIFAVIYGIVSIWNFVFIFVGRGRRTIHSLLLPTIVLFAWSNVLYIVSIVLHNTPDIEENIDLLTTTTVSVLSSLFDHWGDILLFIAILSVLWNREQALRSQTEGKWGARHHPALTTMHVLLGLLMLIFGTAAEAMTEDTFAKLYNSDEFFGVAGRRELNNRIETENNLFYAFQAFVVLTAVDVTVSTVVVWRRWRASGLSDRITNAMLYAVVPMYCILNLFIMIFTIVFSPKALPATGTLEAVESADIADDLLISLFRVGIIITILVLSTMRRLWGNETVQPQYFPTQPQYVYGSPAPVQAGYPAQTGYPAQPGYPVQTGYYTPGAAPMQTQMHMPQGGPTTLYPPQDASNAQTYHNTGMAPENGTYTPQQIQPQHSGYPASSSPSYTTGSPPPGINHGHSSVVGGYTPPPEKMEKSG